MITTVSVDGEVHVLAPDNGLDEVARRIEEAVQAGGRFVQLTLRDGSEVRVLIAAGTHVTIASRPASFPNDEDATPFGSHFDDYS